MKLKSHYKKLDIEDDKNFGNQGIKGGMHY